MKVFLSRGGIFLKKYILIVMLFLLVGCGQSTSGSGDISEEINEYLGVTPYLPETDYPIGHVSIEYGPNPKAEDDGPTKGEPINAQVEYNISQDEKVDEKSLEEWEESNRQEVIYGDLYMDGAAIMVTIFKGDGGEIKDADLIEIDGHEVQYQFIERNTEAVIIRINFDGISYMIQYLAEENDIEEEAKEFAKEIISNQK